MPMKNNKYHLSTFINRPKLKRRIANGFDRRAYANFFQSLLHSFSTLNIESNGICSCQQYNRNTNAFTDTSDHSQEDKLYPCMRKVYNNETDVLEHVHITMSTIKPDITINGLQDKTLLERQHRRHHMRLSKQRAKLFISQYCTRKIDHFMNADKNKKQTLSNYIKFNRSMKFGEHLATHLTPEWSSQYIQYEYMKELLTKAVAEAPTDIHSNDSTSQEAYFRHADISFFQYCTKQLTKIDTFFSEKLNEALRRFDQLNDELQYINMFNDKSTISDSNHDKHHPTTMHRDIVNNTDKLSKRRRWFWSSSRIVPTTSNVRMPEQSESHIIHKTKNNLKVAFTEFYYMLVLLENYRVLNATGFRKILKKHDKLFRTTRGVEWRMLYVDSATFHISTKVTELINETETIFIDAFESGDRTQAMKRLRVPPLEQKHSPQVTFRFGMFFGILCILLPILFILATQLSRSQSGKPLSWRPALLLYRSTCLIIIHIIFVGINIYGWSSSGVNHILIFEIDPRHHLTYEQVLEIGMCLLVLWFLSFIGFILASHYDWYPFVQPLIFIILMLLFILNPIPIFYRQARFWLLKRLVRVFLSPWHAVGFTDFWLGDQLTSLELVFFDFESFFCFYVSDRKWWSSDLTSPAIHQGPLCIGWSEVLLQAIFLVFPSWFRFAQCLRRYRDTRQTFPHLVNAGKYAAGFLTIITNALRRATIETYDDDNELKNPFLYVWIVVAIIGSTYKITWDFKMDWGFFDKKAGTNKYLRDQLVYPLKIYYYMAIIGNILLRYAWTINIFIHFHEQSAEYADLIGFCFGLAEIFRRFVWNFFRLENEHLNNCGQFRAVRDIAIVPLSNDVKNESVESQLTNKPGIRYRHHRVEENKMKDETKTVINE